MRGLKGLTRRIKKLKKLKADAAKRSILSRFGLVVFQEKGHSREEALAVALAQHPEGEKLAELLEAGNDFPLIWLTISNQGIWRCEFNGEERYEPPDS